MSYAQLNESHLEIVAYYENLSGSFKFLDGRTTGNIELLSNEELAEYHIYPVIDNKPSFDSRYQALVQGETNIIGSQVTRTWNVMEYDLSALKEQRIREVNQARDGLINGGVVFDGKLFDSDIISRSNITATAASIGLGEVLLEGFSWRNANNEDVPMDVETFRMFSMTVFGHVYAAHITARNHKDTINAMDTAEAVAAYSID